MNNELTEAFDIIFKTLLIIALPIICAEIIVLLYKAIKAMKSINGILADVDILSDKANKISEDPEAVKKFTQEVISYTANDVITTQTQQVSKKVIDKIMGLLVAYKQ